ncbi:MAG: S9 family peptidase [Opitutaceae bacterium]|jgi:dipeptidyl aminopeptidase/acylaminoacyl peptidase
MRSPLPRPWVFAFVLGLTLQAEPADSLITAADLLKINLPSAPALSPDGQQIAYTVRTLESLSSGDTAYRNRLWLAHIDGDTAPRELTSAGPNAYDPAWHPLGDRIAFIRPEASDRARICVLPVSGGDPFTVTPSLREVTAPQWSPNGDRLLFTAVVTYAEAVASGSANPWPLEKPAAPALPAPEATKPAATKPAPAPQAASDGSLAERRLWLSQNEARGDPFVSTRLDFNADPDTNGEPKFTHLFVIDHAGATPVDLTPGFISYTHPAWLPDGETIVCDGPTSDSAHPDRVLTRRLFTLKADGSELRPLASPAGYSLTEPAVSPDGKQIACTAQPCADPADLSYGQTRLAIITVADGKFQMLTEKFDRSIGHPRWSADGKFIYFVAETGGAAPLHRIPAKGGNPERITSSDTCVTGFSPGSKALALVIARSGNPGEICRTHVNGRSLRILTAHNNEWLRDKKLASPESRKLKRPDGTPIDYWVVKPPYLEGGFHYPLLVMIHGGPGSMWGPATPSVWHEIQFFAARGYGIVFANPRGSSGYGAKFQHANFQDWGPGPAGDVLAAADAVAKENWVDADRQVVLGGSYGGYLTAWIISSDPRFKAAIAERGVYDLTTFLGEGDAWPLVPWHFGGYPWQPEIRKLLDAQSPLTRADAIRTPLLIQQNAADHQTGTAQGELLYRSLKILGRPVEFVSYPHATHELSRTGDPDQRIDRLVRYDEFFQRFIGTPAQPIPPPPAPPSAAPATPAKPEGTAPAAAAAPGK